MKWIKIVLLSLFALIILILAYIIWDYTSHPQKIISLVAGELKRSYSLDLRTGEVRFNLLKGIEIKDIRLSDSEQSNGTEFLTFEEGSIFYNPLSLLSGQIEIISISVKGLRTSDSKLGDVINKISSRVKPQQNEGLNLLIHRVSLENSIIQYDNIDFTINAIVYLDTPIQNIPLNLQISSKYGQLSYYGTYSGGGEISFSDLDINRIFSIGIPFILRKGNGRAIFINNSILSISIKNLYAIFERYEFKTINPFTFSYDFKKRFLQVNEAPVQIGKSLIFLKLLTYDVGRQRLVINSENDRVETSDFIPQTAGTLSGDFDFVKDKGSFLSGKFYLSNFNYLWIENTSGNIQLVNNNLSAEILARTTGGELKARLNCGNIFTDGINIDAGADSFQINSFLSNIKKVPEEKPAGSDEEMVIKIYPVVFNLSIRQAVYDSFDFSDIKIKGVLDKTGLRIDKGFANFLRGNIDFSGLITDSSFNGEMSITEARLKDFSTRFLKDGKRLYGTLNAKSSFMLSLSDLKASKGKISAEILNGEIKDFFLQEKMADVLYDIPMNDIFFDRITFDGNMSDGIFKVSSAVFDSSDIKGKMEAEVLVDTGLIKGEVNLSFSRSYLSELPNVAQIFTSGYQEDDRIVFRVGLGGEIKKPELTLLKK